MRDASGAYVREDGLVGLLPTAGGFDDRTLAYLATVETPAGLVGFYNGNDFGRDGIGVVRLSDQPAAAAA